MAAKGDEVIGKRDSVDLVSLRKLRYLVDHRTRRFAPEGFAVKAAEVTAMRAATAALEQKVVVGWKQEILVGW